MKLSDANNTKKILSLILAFLLCNCSSNPIAKKSTPVTTVVPQINSNLPTLIQNHELLGTEFFTYGVQGTRAKKVTFSATGEYWIEGNIVYAMCEKKIKLLKGKGFDIYQAVGQSGQIIKLNGLPSECKHSEIYVSRITAKDKSISDAELKQQHKSNATEAKALLLKSEFSLVLASCSHFSCVYETLLGIRVNLK